MVQRATVHDACNHAIRLFLPALLDDDWFASARCFAALDAGQEGSESPARAFLIAYEDKQKDAALLQYSVTAIVDPSHRRRGMWRSLLRALKTSLPVSPRLVFEFCKQSKSGLACAVAMGLKIVNECDHYLECTKLKPPATTLPSITPYRASVLDLDEILKIRMGEHPEEDEQQERSILQRDLSDNLQCWLLRIDGVAVASVTFVVSEEDVYVMNVIAIPSARCKGYGEALVRQVAQHGLSNLGRPRVCLETTKPNALRLYLRVGFDIVYSWTSWLEPTDQVLP